MKENLQEKFIYIFHKYSDDKNLEAELWKEIELNYSHKSRHYHNLLHLEHMITELEPLKIEISDWDSLLFSVFYHDIVYKSTAKDNEEKSAEVAKKRLEKLNLQPDQIQKIVHQIIATKSHQKSNDQDINYLLDADLAVLGKSWSAYEIYIKQIRKEYAIYPDFLYNPGRKKVLKNFLTFDTIYKTDCFKNRYEVQARDNIKREIELL